MRILVVIHEYPPIGGGGGKAAQVICEGLADHLKTCGVEQRTKALELFNDGLSAVAELL